jgi:ABC-type oligopeptide transport system substrate-binding subunit
VLDLTTAAVAQARIPTGTEQFVAVGGGYGWVSDETKGVVYKIDQAGNLAATYHTGEGARPVSLDNGVLWVANQDVGTVTGIDALTGVTRTFRFGHPTPDLAAGDGRVLVGVSPGQTYEDRIDTLRGKVAKMLVQPYQLAGDDPAIDSTWLAYQVEYATCAKLLNYPDLAGTRGAQLRPEVAAAMPILTDDRRTYTFRVRPGYRFSPPSNQAVTAETFRHSIERALSPKLGNVLPGSRVIGDISGEAAYRAGTAQHISGLKAKGDTLTITLARPSADFLQRLATPIFCPVPNGATLSLDGGDVWTTPGHQLTIPSAGPYYIADFNSGEYLILKRNPNYRGSRPHALDAIALREGVDPGQAVRRVLNGSWDGVMNMYDPLLDPDGEIGQRWGAQSPAAVDGDQQYFAVPTPGVDVLAFNSSRPPFSNPRVRRAVALALNRSELASTRPVANNQGIVAISEAPSAQLLPPDQPGYRIRGDAHPLAADQARAKALMRGRHLTAALAVPGNCETCLRWARTLQYQLAEVGITVRIKAVADPQAAVRHPGTRLDMIETSATQDYADPAAFLETLVGHDVPTSWLPRSVHGELSTLRHSVGEAHIDAAGMLAHQLATVQVPATAFAYQVNGQFFSPRLGCRIFPPFGYGVDLAALCLPHS